MTQTEKKIFALRIAIEAIGGEAGGYSQDQKIEAIGTLTKMLAAEEQRVKSS